ncbi:5-(carboxyamino)imidazole ribonucleotide synthase [Pararhodobacter oceanensis]|uniref:5-(carboxyamino)imidazole ribonucleotide synthase n=1 Tax=Pararhodobacter oceanensis TaxID=2172121 RepID=UPI003A939704
MSEMVPVGGVIGILGGGQLGRMLSVAAARLGLRCHIYDPSPNPPAGQVAETVTTAAWDDAAALRAFAESVDVITYEFENIPTAALDILEALRPVRPGRQALAVSQDRLTEKDFLRDLGLVTAPYRDVPDEAALQAALSEIGAPAILKTRRLGYDGKGQARIMAPEQGAEALAGMAGQDAILEGFVEFGCEISVIAARGVSGEVACYDPGENIHEDGILRRTTLPASVTPMQQMDAVLLAGKILNALEYVGVMGVELFVTPRGLVVNEIAPRVHNSGHWTQAGCAVDQFEQHIRAVAGWPLGNGARHVDVVMENLIGDDMARVPELAREADVQLHLYGKGEARAGRKMGHVNRIMRG